MHLRLAHAVLCFGTLACARSAPRGSTIEPSAAAKREVVQTAERLFEGMRTRDTALLRTLLAPGLAVVASRPDGPSGPRVQAQSVDAFLRAVADSREELRERIWAPEVRLDGTIATLWAPYDFHRGARFSHCGTDAFQLVRAPDRWIVTGLTYTVRTTPCPGPPPAR
jgi:hypothetical protein